MVRCGRVPGASSLAGRPAGFYRACAAVALGVLLCAPLLGCEPSRAGPRQFRARLENIRDTATVLAEWERARPAKLRQTGDWFVNEHIQRPQRFVRDITYADKDFFQRDYKRWLARQPDYWREAGRLLWCKPQRIEETAIQMFY
jgi:hypothetical protein